MLNSKQMKIVNSDEKSIFVVSGAGTGKTTVIYNRILHLLSKNIDSKSILAISFTRRTVNDLNLKFYSRADNPIVKTFHGLAFSHIGSHFSKALVDHSSELFSLFDVRELQNIVLKKGVLAFKNMTTKPLSSYNAILNKNDLFDYVDLEIEFLYLLKELKAKNTPLISYSYIFIDESQDLSNIQVEILKHLVHNDTCICFVGDPDQSIYKFRGSAHHMVNHIIKTFGCSVYALDDTYRSTQSIINAANTLIKHNHHRFPKVLKAHRKEVGIIEFHQFNNTKKEANFVFSKIRYFLDQKHPQKDMIILVRNHFQATEIKRLLQSSYYLDVDCLSIHQSKGLEYRIVFIMGIEDKRPISRQDLEEERRLFFVGMTRAKDILIMTSPSSFSIPRFVKESKVIVTKH